MKLKVLEKHGNLVRIQVEGEGHTLLNLIREKAWLVGAKQASYMIKHPYLSTPELIIKSPSYKKVLADAAELVEKEAKEFAREFKRAAGKG